MKKWATNKLGTINGLLQNEKSEFFLITEERKTLLELNINGSGIDEGSLILKAEICDYS